MSENLDQIEQKISSLITYRLSLINELKKLSQRKHELREEIKGITNKLREEKKAISEQSSLIRQLGDTRKDILLKIDEIKTKVKETDKVLRKFEKEVPHESERTLKEKLDNIEWKLQTEPLTREEEKQLVEYIKKLEFKLHLWKKAYMTRQELSELLVEAKSLMNKLDEMSEIKKTVLIKLRNQKETLYNIVMTKQQLIQEDKEIEQDIEEIKKNLDHIDAELSKLKENKIKLLDKKRLDEMASIKIKEQSLLEEVRSKARDKLTKGKSLSWDELKILFEDKNE
ncbi:MAG: hypothetical protein H3Z52_09255 [archaeon]|nr:hypothetical protein [archaeon]MCP8321109.1 hypothetical protein [archaeon]